MLVSVRALVRGSHKGTAYKNQGGGASTDPTPALQTAPIGWDSLGASQSGLRVVFFSPVLLGPALILKLKARVDFAALVFQLLWLTSVW